MEQIGFFISENVGNDVKRLAKCFALVAKGNGMDGDTMKEAAVLYEFTTGQAAPRNLSNDAQNYLKMKILEQVPMSANLSMQVGRDKADQQFAAARKLGFIK